MTTAISNGCVNRIGTLESMDEPIRRDYFKFDVMTEVIVTEAFVDTLILSSERHYDRLCREQSMEGGCLRGMKNSFSYYRIPEAPPKTITWQLSTHDLDVLAKVTEPLVGGDFRNEPRLEAHGLILKLLWEAKAEWKRVNVEYAARWSRGD